ncbi:PREDICTED: uncharacterized protein LOC106116315 isoform X2 [Papilio xuthus]|uniref:Uncharacterized protein LOC106116315 isoform X2 n=1 Tax=Papilio xuthus TaxID=66420 RepID=A0AAJ6Z587_PAPXU|nr:PREDICTED: uncharacterized protein LOC106116315 isoform X2 [Papilio xuthus]
MTVARGEGSPERLGGALRRLHYRATRRAHSAAAAAARHHANTPSKVVVMGSSTTSDKTINTSTDSAATALTSVTGTDDSMDAEPDPPDSLHQHSLIDADPPGLPQHIPPSTAPPHYHRPQDSCDIDSPAYTKPQSATDVIESPRPGPARFVFDVPLPEPRPETKPRNKIQVSQTSGPSTSIQIPFDPKLETPKSPKASQTKYETHFKFEPEVTKRRGSEPRVKNKQKLDKQDYYKDEVAKLRRQLEGTEVFTTNRRRSSAHQHSVPPPSSRRQSTAAQVHVTANPLDSATTTIPAGRTTIVVQQPSLSLDYGGCSTILVRDGEDGGRRKSRVCSDHIQQLLDVTSQFTSEDLHEFDKRYGSPHHSRSQSVKAARSRTGERQLLGLPQQRARVASMPNTGVEEEYYRLRHFSITGKGVVNRGDSLRSRRSRSNTSVASSASSTEAVTRASAPCSLASSRDSSAGLSAYRVLVLGAPGVGKSSLIGQFMTSEYLHAYDTSIDDESGERSVCVLLAGEESEITFLDSPPEHVISEGCAHGYCVVYSTADRSSFAEAERRLQALWAAGHTARRAVILVANKADLARSRLVPTDEGKSLATSYECKFIETSVGINHNVDELLVGLLTQIRLKQQHADRVRKRSNPRKPRGRARSPVEGEPPSAASTPRKRTRLSASVKVRGLLGRVWARDSKSKSCENLHVL